MIMMGKTDARRRNIIAYNKSEKAREISRRNGARMGKKYGPINGKIAGKKTGAKNFAIYNKSEKHREISRQNIVKVRKMTTTPSQQMLSKALIENGIHNHMEHYFPTIRRLGDIAIPSSKLIIEVDGSSHERGIFCTKEQKQTDDKIKEEQIKSLGWKVVRFTNKDVEYSLSELIQQIKLLL